MYWAKLSRKLPTTAIGCHALVICAICVVIGGCKEDTPQKLYAINPEYFEWYSLREAPDAAHTIEITEVPTGNIWYRAGTPGLNLRHFQIEETYVADLAGKYAVLLHIADLHRGLLASWTKAHIGEPAGAVFNGDLVYVADIQVVVEDVVAIPAFDTLDEAEQVMMEIRRGGLEARPTSQRSTAP